MFVKLEKDERKKRAEKEQYVKFKRKERKLSESLKQKNKNNSIVLALNRTKVRQWKKK